MTTSRKRFTAPQRFLHWLMAICILSMLFIGVGMVSTVTPKYLTLVQIHKPLGIAILVLALIRLVLRFIYKAPALPPDLPVAAAFANIRAASPELDNVYYVYVTDPEEHLLGALSLRPNLINVVPNRAVFTVDLRNTDEARLKEAESRVAEHIAELARQEKVEVEARVLARFEPVIFDAGLVDRVERHARALGLSTRRMPSGAGHDAQMMQRICPTAMIFVPSVAGLSHNVKEHTEPVDLAAGAQVLLNLLVELASEG